MIQYNTYPYINADNIPSLSLYRYLFHLDEKIVTDERTRIKEFVAQFPQAILLNLSDSIFGQWGYVSLTMMEITLWARALQVDPSIDYFINLSGNDFPVQSLSSLEEYLASDAVYGKSLVADFGRNPSTRWHYINLCGYNRMPKWCFLMSPNWSLEAGAFWRSGAIKNFMAGFFTGES